VKTINPTLILTPASVAQTSPLT